MGLFNDVKEIFGVGLGSLDIRLDHYQFSWGETIDGVVRLRLTKPIEARGLYVGLLAKRKVISYNRGGHGRSVSNEKAYDFQYPLLHEGTYQTEDLTFSLVIPGEVATSSPNRPPGRLGDIAQVLAFLSPTTRLPLHWWVQARLALPRKLDLKAKSSITVLSPTEPAAE